MTTLGLASALALAACAPSRATGKPPARRIEAAPGSARTATLEHAVVELVNRHRRARGLLPLVLDSRISHQAELHSTAMAAGTTPLGHAGFDGRVAALRREIAFRRSAENVAFNQGHRDPAAEAVRGWLASREHRGNVEGPYELTGVGVVSNAKGEVYFTQVFVGR